MKISNIEKIIFIGGNRYGENGPLISFAEIARQQGIGIFVITTPEQSEYPTKSGGSLKGSLEKKNFDYLVTDKLELSFIEEMSNKNTLLFLINCKWIIKSNLIERYNKRIVNYHNSEIPKQKGAACHSWRIMVSEHRSALTIHHVVEEVDEGKAITCQKVEFPEDVKTLKQSYLYIESIEKIFFKNLIKQRYSGNCTDQSSKGFYWPRINTQVNGFIDWNWSAKEIQQFVNAFSDPFDGAGTFVEEDEIRLKEVELDDIDTYFHPFQYGLVYRKIGNNFWVAAAGSGLKVIRYTSDCNMRIRVGKRLFTPAAILERAKKIPR